MTIDTKYLIVGNRRLFDARTEVPLPDSRRHILEILYRTNRDRHGDEVEHEHGDDRQHDFGVHYGAGGDPCNGEHRHDTKVRADQFRDERHTQRGEADSASRAGPRSAADELNRPIRKRGLH